MKTRSIYLLAVAGGVVLLALAVPRPISGQSPVPPSPVQGDAECSPQVVALVKQLTEQNKQLVANQAAIDAKLADVEESIRQARIYAARSGGNVK